VDCGSASARQGALCVFERVRARTFDECGVVTCCLFLQNLFTTVPNTTVPNAKRVTGNLVRELVEPKP
jgi:hypothetical protein